MPVILECFDTSRNDSVVYSRPYKDEKSAYTAAARDFKLKSMQFGLKEKLQPLKSWVLFENFKSIDTGIIYGYRIINN